MQRKEEAEEDEASGLTYNRYERGIRDREQSSPKRMLVVEERRD
jgi:hypothetical protein